MKKKRIQLDDVHGYLKARDASLLSPNILKTMSDKGTFKCRLGHIWTTAIYSVYYGISWCPDCSISRCEAMALYIIERLTGKKFVKTRRVLPSKLELDGYNDELQLALEYNGAQHYIKNEKFHHREEGSFEKQLHRDMLKASECDTLGIKLVIVPYKCKTFLKIRDHIVRTLLCDPLYWDCIDLQHDWVDAEAQFVRGFDISSQALNKIKERAKVLGGECLATHYINNSSHLPFKCANNDHPIFYTTSSDLLRRDGGRWCPECGGTKKKTEDHHIDLIENQLGGTFVKSFSIKKGDIRNGSVVSKARTFIVFMCQNGHRCESSMDNIKRAIRTNAKSRGCIVCKP